MTAISSPSKLAAYALSTVTFEDMATHDGQEFGFQAGQPYASLGLVIHAASVAAKTNLNSASSGVAVRSDTIYTGNYSNSLYWQFSPPQRAVGFYYRDLRATSFQVTARDANWSIVDTATFAAGEGYAGFTRASADIETVMTAAGHLTVDDAIQSRTYIDDLSFARELKSERVNLNLEPGQFVIIVGAVRADGNGIVIGPHGVRPVPPWNPDMRGLVVAVNLLQQADSFDIAAVRKELKFRAASLLKASVKGLSKGSKRRDVHPRRYRRKQ